MTMSLRADEVRFLLAFCDDHRVRLYTGLLVKQIFCQAVVSCSTSSHADPGAENLALDKT